MSAESVWDEVLRFGERAHIPTWEGIPWGGATVLTPETQTLDEFLSFARTANAPILYVDADGSTAAFAIGGVVHVFATTPERRRLRGNDEADYEDSFLDEEEDHVLPNVSISVLGGGLRDYDDPYYDWRSLTVVTGRAREVVDALVADNRFNGYRSGHVVSEYVAQLSAEEAEAVEHVARRVFDETVGKQLDHEATRLTQSLVTDPQYDPLLWGTQHRQFIEDRVDDADPRLIERLERSLTTYADESGARSAAERELSARARGILRNLSPVERDVLGFTSKAQARLVVLAPHLDGESGSRAEWLLRKIADFEQEQFALNREARYATAARHLQARGMTRAGIARQLRISTSVLERIVATHRRDVEIPIDDPIRTEFEVDLP